MFFINIYNTQNTICQGTNTEKKEKAFIWQPTNEFIMAARQDREMSIMCFLNSEKPRYSPKFHADRVFPVHYYYTDQEVVFNASP